MSLPNRLKEIGGMVGSPDGDRVWVAMFAEALIFGDEPPSVLHCGCVDEAVGGIAGEG
jgi:hypothetical protein